MGPLCCIQYILYIWCQDECLNNGSTVLYYNIFGVKMSVLTMGPLCCITIYIFDVKISVLTMGPCIVCAVYLVSR